MGLVTRLRDSIWRDRRADEVSAELAAHEALAIERLMEEGMREEDARREAKKRLGAAGRLAEETRDEGVIPWLDAWSRDLRLAARSLARRPRLALTAILSIALGVGANSAIFSVFDAVILRPLPFAEPDRLVVVAELKRGSPAGGNPVRLMDWASLPGFEAVMGMYVEGAASRTADGPSKVRVMRTVGDVLTTLKVRPGAGRAFTAEELRGEGVPPLLLTARYAAQRFGSTPAVGQTIDLDGLAHTVVGVLPPSFLYPPDVDALAPAPLAVQRTSRKAGFLFVVARLATGMSREQAAAQAQARASQLAAQYPDSDDGLTVQVNPLEQTVAAEYRQQIVLLFGMVAMLLLLACVNVAGLLAARAAERERESAIRLSLGASRFALARLYLSESLMLSVLGAAAGLVLAVFLLDLLKTAFVNEVPRLAEAAIDGRALGFTGAIALTCGFLAGLAPAWRAARSNFAQKLRRFPVLRGGLVGVQAALAVCLLGAATLLAAGLLRLERLPLGFEPTGILTARVNFSWNTDKTQLDRFRQDATAALASIPGIRSVGVADRLPLDGGSQDRPLEIRGVALPPELSRQSVGFRAIDERYFETLGVKLVQGEWLREQTGSMPNILVNEAFVRRYLPEGEAIGREIRFDKDGRWYRIVGVVANVRRELAQTVDPPETYVSMRETYWPMFSFVLDTDGDPVQYVKAVRETMARVAPSQVVDTIAPLTREIALRFRNDRLLAAAAGAFALSALASMWIGLYGVLASNVVLRRKEFAIRLALGAEPKRVAWAALRQAALLVGAGSLAGLGGALFAAQWIRPILPGGEAQLPPLPLMAGFVVLLALATLAACQPAWRAARIDPSATLRHD